jgi:hypothetical protein
MKHIVFGLFLTIMSQSYAVESPYDKFSAKSNFTDKTTVKWVQVDNIRMGCDKESKRRGFAGYPKPIEGCSFWDTSIFGHSCLIMTPKRVDYWLLGHELRHCFFGSFHKD